MVVNGDDDRLCQAALDGLKTFGLTELTTRFLEKHHLLDDISPAPKNLDEMWVLIERWLEDHPSRCRKLWEYVDELRMWGHQRIFLYEVDSECLADLSSPAWVRKRVGNLYDDALFTWDADEPFLARAVHTEAPGTGHRILLFKLIENREYDLVLGDRVESFSERSTNFFVVDLETGHAELRIQELQTGAKRGLKEERDRLWALVGNYLDLDKFQPIDLTPVMEVMLLEPIYRVTASRLKFPQSEGSATAPALATFFDKLFRPPTPLGLNAYCECEQEVVRKDRLHFEISGGIDYVGFGGISDPAQVNRVLDNIVQLAREPVPPIPPPSRHPLADKMLAAVGDDPQARAAVLSAGAIAAAVIWMVAEALGTYAYEETVEWLLGGLPIVVITIPVEFAWILWYYGWRRVVDGFKALFGLGRRDVWKAILDARKRRKELVATH